VALRPGAKDLIAHLSQFYELIIYTTQQGYVNFFIFILKLAEPVVAALDPYSFCDYRLYRDHTRLIKGKYIKDLDQLNRDVGKVIVVDINPQSYSLHPDNGVQVSPWQGEEDDNELSKLETCLHGIYLLFRS
jgi:import inner membrane translocase subunit TIM50